MRARRTQFCYNTNMIIPTIIVFVLLGLGALKFEKWKAKQIAKEIKKKDKEL